MWDPNSSESILDKNNFILWSRLKFTLVYLYYFFFNICIVFFKIKSVNKIRFKCFFNFYALEYKSNHN